MIKPSVSVCIITVTAVLALTGPALAETKSGTADGVKAGVTEKRIMHMRAIADDMRVVADMLFGIEPFDAARVEKLMGQVRGRTGPAMLAQFPKGSVSPDSRAMPNIWTPDGSLNKDFASGAQALETLAGKLQTYAEAEGKAGTVARVQAIVAKSAYLNIDRKLLAEARTAMKPLRDTFMSMAGHCKGCHESFRMKKEEKPEGNREKFR